jgi:hypothetical protein
VVRVVEVFLNVAPPTESGTWPRRTTTCFPTVRMGCRTSGPSTCAPLASGRFKPLATRCPGSRAPALTFTRRHLERVRHTGDEARRGALSRTSTRIVAALRSRPRDRSYTGLPLQDAIQRDVPRPVTGSPGATPQPNRSAAVPDPQRNSRQPTSPRPINPRGAA